MLMPEAAVMHANMPRDTSSELAIVLSHLVAVLAGLSGLAVFIRWRLEKLSKQSRPPPQPQRTQRSNAASGYVTASKAQALPEKPLQGSGIEDSAGAVHPQTALATRSLEQKHSSSQVQDVVRMPCGEQGPRRSDDLLNDSVDDILSTKPDAELLAVRTLCSELWPLSCLHGFIIMCMIRT